MNDSNSPHIPTTHATYEDAIRRLVNDHPGLDMPDEVVVLIDDCVYRLTYDGEGNIVGTDTFTSVEDFKGFT